MDKTPLDIAAELLCGDLMLGPTKKLELIKEHLTRFESAVRQDERQQCSKRIINHEGEEIEKGTAVMLCVMG